MELKLFKLQLIYHNYSSKSLLIKIFFLATLLAFIPYFDLLYPITSCNHSLRFEKSNFRMNVSELHSAFKELITSGNWLNRGYKTLTVGRESIRAVMVLRKLGFRDAIGVDRKPCCSMVKRGNIYGLPFEKNSFDFVFSMAMIDGVRVPARMVLEMERVLKPERVGVVLRRVSGHVPTRDVMKAAAPVASYLKSSNIVGVRTMNRTVMVVFRKRFIGFTDKGNLDELLKPEKTSSPPLLLVTQ